MEKKKVLFLSAANSIHTVKWVNSLSEYFDVYLVYCKNHTPQLDNLSTNVNLRCLPFNAPLGYYLNAYALNKIYHEVNPDIVNVHYASGYGTLARVARLKDVLLSIWGSDVYDFPNESILKKHILRKNVMYAKSIASTSNVMAKELKRQIPELKTEIHITPFGVDTEKFKQLSVERNNNGFNIGIVKTLSKKYGIEYVIHAIKMLKSETDKYSNVKLYIYGDGPDKDNMQQLIEQLELNDCVFLMGKIPNEQVPEALNKFDFFCATSIYNSESFGVAVVEAMACSLPVIVTDVDGFKEVVVDNETGFIIERKNVTQIAQKIKDLINNEELRKNMGIAGRKRVLELYNWKENVKTMCDIYINYRR